MPLSLVDRLLVALAIAPLFACGNLSAHGGPETLARDHQLDRRAVRSGACVDMGFALQGRGDVSPILLVAHFGNRCDEPSRLDLERLQITATRPDGTVHELHLVDPRSEIAPLHLESGVAAVEKVQLGPLENFAPVRVCVDVRAAIDGADGAAPICFSPRSGSGFEVAP